MHVQRTRSSRNIAGVFQKNALDVLLLHPTQRQRRTWRRLIGNLYADGALPGADTEGSEQRVNIYRLGKIVASTQLDGLYCGGNARVTGQYDDAASGQIFLSGATSAKPESPARFRSSTIMDGIRCSATVIACAMPRKFRF